MWVYANNRIKKIQDAGLISREEIYAIAEQWDWSSLDEKDDTCNGDEFGELEEVNYSKMPLVEARDADDNRRAPTTDW